jgi:hypothetical protein
MTPTSGLGFPPGDAPPQDAGATLTAAPAEYVSLSESLKQLRGADFEDHAHPAVVLDGATGPTVRVWGWWAEAQPALPCILWASERGWSVTVVEPGALDTEGYERTFWSHRINLLDLAIANALGPYPTLELLELNVAAEDSFGSGAWACELRTAVQWGIVQLRAARAHGRRPAQDGVRAFEHTAAARGVVDEELARHALVPTLAKPRWSIDPTADPGMAALLRAVHRAGLRTASATTAGRTKSSR